MRCLRLDIRSRSRRARSGYCTRNSVWRVTRRFWMPYVWRRQRPILCWRITVKSTINRNLMKEVFIMHLLFVCYEVALETGTGTTTAETASAPTASWTWAWVRPWWWTICNATNPRPVTACLFFRHVLFQTAMWATVNIHVLAVECVRSYLLHFCFTVRAACAVPFKNTEDNES